MEVSPNTDLYNMQPTTVYNDWYGVKMNSNTDIKIRITKKILIIFTELIGMNIELNNLIEVKRSEVGVSYK